jgi:predicted protein tyrosine phosphatase
MCSRKRLRSTSAKYCSADICGIKILLARTNSGAGEGLSGDFVGWSDIALIAEGMQCDKLRRRHRFALGCRKVVVLGIPDKLEDIGMETVRSLVAVTVLRMPLERA